MSTFAPFAADLVAIIVLSVAVYFPRHRRRDLIAAFLGVNVGVLAVASVLQDGTFGAGLGLGLFGVLSIIRLRSTELEQHEVAYYFSALALGLIAGLGGHAMTTYALMAMIIAVMVVGDHPALFRRSRHQVVVVDRAITREDELTAHLESLLDATVHVANVQRVDLVNDTTVVDVRFERRRPTKTSVTPFRPEPARAGR